MSIAKINRSMQTAADKMRIVDKILTAGKIEESLMFMVILLLYIHKYSKTRKIRFWGLGQKDKAK